MVNISLETSVETRKRLLRVITRCELKVYPDSFAFQEFPLRAFPEKANGEALAFVRDDTVWSQLVPCSDETGELFTLFRFHFPAGADNSGFVGWLASHIKEKFGSGVFVVCGQNRNAGGIFDYWGCPLELGEAVVAEMRRLVAGPTAR